MSTIIKAKSSRENDRDVTSGGAYEGQESDHLVHMLTKAARAAFTMYFKKFNDFLTDDGENSPEVEKIQKWINGQKLEASLPEPLPPPPTTPAEIVAQTSTATVVIPGVGTPPPTGIGTDPLQDIPAIIARMAAGVIAEPPPDIANWLYGAKYNVENLLGGAAEYEIEITIKDKSFKTYVKDRKMYKTKRMVPLVDDIPEWWNHLINKPWLSQEDVKSITVGSEQNEKQTVADVYAQELVYNVVMLAAEPSTGGALKSIKDLSEEQITRIKQIALKEGHKIIIQAVGREIKEDSNEGIKEKEAYTTWQQQARLPNNGLKISDWLHLRAVPKPPYVPETVNYAVVRVQVPKATIDALHEPYEEIDSLSDLPGGVIEKVEFYSAKNLQNDLNFLCEEKTGDKQGALYHYADMIKKSNYRFTPDLSLAAVGDLMKTFYEKFVQHLRKGPKDSRVDTEEVFNKDSEFAFEITFDSSYTILSIKLLQPKEGTKFDFSNANKHAGVTQNIKASKIVYFKRKPGIGLKVKSEVEEKTEATSDNGPPSTDFEKSEVMLSEECMSLLYNLKKMVYEAEGFSKTAARKDTWENFLDEYISPQRTYVEEPNKVVDPKVAFDTLNAANIPVATRVSMNEHRTATENPVFRQQTYENRKNNKDSVVDLYTDKEIKQEEDVTTIEKSYKTVLRRKDVRTYASKAAQCLWPKGGDLIDTLFEAAVDKLCVDQIVDQLLKTVYPPDSNTTIFDIIENSGLNDGFSATIKEIQGEIEKHSITMEKLADERATLKAHYNEALNKYAEKKLEQEELMILQFYKSPDFNEKELTIVKNDLNEIIGTTDDGPNTTNSHSLMYLEKKLKLKTEEEMQAEVAYSNSVGKTLPMGSASLALKMKNSLKSKETTLAQSLASDDLTSAQTGKLKKQLNQLKGIRETVHKNIISQVPGYSKVLDDAHSEFENLSYDKFIKNLTPKRLTIPNIPRLPTDDIMAGLFQELKRLSLEIASTSVNGMLSKLIGGVAVYCEEGKDGLLDAMGVEDLAKSPGVKNLNNMLSDASKLGKKAKKIFEDFGIKAEEEDESYDEDWDYTSEWDEDLLYEDSLDDDEYSPMAATKSVYDRPRPRKFEKFLDDVSAVLTPRELCTLVEGRPSRETLTYIDRIMTTGYPDIKSALTSATKVKTLFGKLGDLLPPNEISNIRRDLRDINARYEDICPPDDPKINYREAIIEDRVSPEQDKEFLDAIRKARKKIFIDALDIATGDPGTHFDNLYNQTGKPGEEECVDSRTGVPYSKPKNNCGNDTAGGLFMSPKTEAEDYLSDLVRDTVFGPVEKTFSSDINSFFNILLPSQPREYGTATGASTAYKSLAPGTSPSVLSNAFAEISPVPLYKRFLSGYASDVNRKIQIAKAKNNNDQVTQFALDNANFAISTGLDGVKIVMQSNRYLNSWKSIGKQKYAYSVPFSKNPTDPEELENHGFNGSTPFWFGVGFSEMVQLSLGQRVRLKNYNEETYLPELKVGKSLDVLDTPLEELKNLTSHTWQAAQFLEKTKISNWEIPSYDSLSNEDRALIDAYLERRLFPGLVKGIFGLMFKNFANSYFLKGDDHIRRISKLLKDSLIQATLENSPRIDINNNILEMEKIKNAGKEKEKRLDCGAPQGALSGPGPFEAGNIDSIVLLLMRIYAIELALGNLTTHSVIDLQELLRQQGSEGTLVDYLTQVALSDLRTYRSGKLQLAKKDLSTPDYPEDVLYAVHDIMVERRKAGEIFYNPVTRKAYDYDAFDLGEEGDPEHDANQKLPTKVAGAGGWVGIPDFEYKKKVKINKRQLEAEFKHILWEQTMSVFNSLSENYMLAGAKNVDDLLLNTLMWPEWSSDIFRRMPFTSRDQQEDKFVSSDNVNFLNPETYKEYSKQIATFLNGVQNVWTDADLAKPVLEEGDEGTSYHGVGEATWGGQSYNPLSPFLLGFGTESIFGDMNKEPSRTGLYLQPYIKVEWNPEYLTTASDPNNPSGELLTKVTGLGQTFPGLVKDGVFGGYINIHEWQAFCNHILPKTDPFYGVNPTDPIAKYFNLSWGLRMVVVTEPGSIIKENLSSKSYKALENLFDLTYVDQWKGSKEKTYAHRVWKVKQHKYDIKNENLEYTIQKDFVFSIPLIDVQEPIVFRDVNYFHDLDLFVSYPLNTLKEKMRDSEDFRNIFGKYFNLNQIASCASIVGHSIISTSPGYKDVFKNTKSHLKSLFYTMQNSHDYKHESDGLKVAHNYSDTLFGGDVMNMAGSMPVDPSKMVRMTQHIIIEAMADLIEPSWDWTYLNYTVPGTLATLSDILKPGWFDDAGADQHLRNKKRKKGSEPNEKAATKPPKLVPIGSPGVKKAGEK